MFEEKSHSFTCPSCGAINTLVLDMSEGNTQEWMTDCEVCCRGKAS